MQGFFSSCFLNLLGLQVCTELYSLNKVHHILAQTKTPAHTGPCYRVVFLIVMRAVLNHSKGKRLSGHVTDSSEQHCLALSAVSHIQKSMQLSEGNDCFRFVLTESQYKRMCNVACIKIFTD